MALIGAVFGGHTPTVTLLLQFRNDISADHAGKALRVADQGGHTDIVNLLLQRHTDLSADQAGLALREVLDNDDDKHIEIRTALQAYIASRS